MAQNHFSTNPNQLSLLTTPTNINQLIPSHQLHSVLNNSNNGGGHLKQKISGTCIENFARLSPSSLSIISQANTNSAVLATDGSRQKNLAQQHPQSFYNHYRQLSSLHGSSGPIKMQPIPHDVYPFNFRKLSGSINDMGEESSNGDEIKNFRNQERDSFSASSRPGEALFINGKFF